MEIEIDCRGLGCPGPVIMTRERLAAGRGSFTVLVDNDAARENVSRFARNAGCSVEVCDHEDGYLITVKPCIRPGASADPAMSQRGTAGVNTVIFVSSDEVGRGDRELGTTLMKAFLYACVESKEKPAFMVFMNSGVRLVTENEETVGHLRRLQEAGVEVVVCGTCLDFYGLKDTLKVGRVSNMYEIQSMLVSADRLVSV